MGRRDRWPLCPRCLSTQNTHMAALAAARTVLKKEAILMPRLREAVKKTGSQVLYLGGSGSSMERSA